MVERISQARRHGYGGLVYQYVEGSEHRFPADVDSLLIVLRVVVDHDRYGNPELANVLTRWPVRKPNEKGCLWKLKGTFERPTLTPSLYWKGSWHGWLDNGVLRFIGT